MVLLDVSGCGKSKRKSNKRMDDTQKIIILFHISNLCVRFKQTDFKISV